MSPTLSLSKTSRVRKSKGGKRKPKKGIARPSVSKRWDAVEELLHEPEIKSFLESNTSILSKTKDAARRLLSKHPEAPTADLVITLRRIMEALSRGTMRVFFSYKAKDHEVAEKIAGRLRDWSAGKLEIKAMERFPEEQAGQEWKKEILKQIKQSDWFLLLLPSFGEQAERDWVMVEAGYYMRGQDLAGRLVCLHHPHNAAISALSDLQLVPAERGKVVAFLKGLFKMPNWIPGMPALYADLSDLDTKAREIVDLIQPPSVRTCCGPHMEVKFPNATEVKGWQELAAGEVIDSNEDCKRLFGLTEGKPSFGGWLNRLQGAGQDEGWVMDLAHAVQSVGDGETAPAISSTTSVRGKRRVQPAICAVTRRKQDHKVEAIDFLFNEVDLPRENKKYPDLSALTITLMFAVPFRYRVLERFKDRKLSAKDVMDFDRDLTALRRELTRDPRFADRKAVQSKVIDLFTGENKAVVEKMYRRAGQLWRDDGQGEMDLAIAAKNGEALEQIIKELLDLNRDFLVITSTCFAGLIANPS